MNNFLEHGGIPQHRNLNMVASPKLKNIILSCFPLLPYPLAPQLVQMEVEPWPNSLEKNKMIVGT
jgi:hypothetical protein